MQWIVGIIVEKVLEFLSNALTLFIKKEIAEKESEKQIDQDEAAKAEALKNAKTANEVEDAAKNSIGHI